MPTMTTCPKCTYERQPADAAPSTECPRCGVVFEKFLLARDRARAQQQSTLLTPALKRPEFEETKPSEDSPHAESGLRQDGSFLSGMVERTGVANRYILGAMVVGIALGYVAGREHLKYEIRSAFSGVGEALSKPWTMCRPTDSA